jgi:hypothetical protein
MIIQERQSPSYMMLFCGIRADGSSFSKAIPALQAEGHEVIAAQYGLDTLEKRCCRSEKRVQIGHAKAGPLVRAVSATGIVGYDQLHLARIAAGSRRSM